MFWHKLCIMPCMHESFILTCINFNTITIECLSRMYSGYFLVMHIVSVNTVVITFLQSSGSVIFQVEH